MSMSMGKNRELGALFFDGVILSESFYVVVVVFLKNEKRKLGAGKK